VFSLGFLVHDSAQYTFLCGMSCCDCRGAQGHSYGLETELLLGTAVVNLILYCTCIVELSLHTQKTFSGVEQPTTYTGMKRKRSFIFQF